jgi:hypothetical protein
LEDGTLKRWGLLVAFLYLLIILALTGPVVILAFWPKVRASELAGVFSIWPYWALVAILVLSEVALLAVPVGVASRRPIKRRSLFLPVLVSGLMMASLVFGAVVSVAVLSAGDEGISAWPAALLTAVLIWIIWTVIFFNLSRNAEPTDVITRQCRYLLRGSILELLIAVPTHIYVRSKDYCCADFMTFIGITLGISVMLISFGPAVFFLFVDRWRHQYKHLKMR